MVVLAVSGSAHRLLPAERGTVRLRLGLEADDRGTAMRGVSALHARFAAEAESHVRDGAATRWAADQVRAWVEHRYLKDSDVTSPVHVAAAEVEVRFRDFAALSAWVTTAAAEAGVTVSGIEWTVTDASRAAAEREVRVQAVADAVERATTYARAVGADGVELRQLWEPGLRPGSGMDGEGVRTRALAAVAGDGVELRPRDIEVAASVTADFVTR